MSTNVDRAFEAIFGPTHSATGDDRRMNRTTFTRKADGSVTSTIANKVAFARSRRAAGGGIVPFDLKEAAARDLTDEARKLEFAKGKTYEECVNYCLNHHENRDWFRVAMAPICHEQTDGQVYRDLGISFED